MTTIHIDDSGDRAKAFLKFIRGLDFVQIEEEETDWYDDLTAEQKEDIETSRKQILEGKGIPHSEVQKEVDKLLGRI
tara:strand:+ start:240 stop:470 length:231 start_codon:yes stop_codon:yes gene_type:complete